MLSMFYAEIQCKSQGLTLRHVSEFTQDNTHYCINNRGLHSHIVRKLYVLGNNRGLYLHIAPSIISMRK